MKKQNLKETRGYQVVAEWMATQNKYPFEFQEKTWINMLKGTSGLVNAPTGCGKTYSVFLGAIIDFINRHEDYLNESRNGLQLLWVTPLRALAKDIGRAMQEVITGLNLQWNVGIRNGDTEMSERQKQKRRMPEILIITPESLHLLLAQKDYPETFRTLRYVAVDEWHELLGSKRGVQVELALSRLAGLRVQQSNLEQSKISQSKSLQSKNSQRKNNQSKIPLQFWGISATIGNLEEAKEVLLKPLSLIHDRESDVIIRAEINKPIEILSIFPDEIEKYPWAGHLGIKLVDKVIPIILSSKTTLIFINTRGMSEMWYQALLNACPDLAGQIAIHHGSIDLELRNWVEENLHSGLLKAVVCTASLDLGVDFRPVETVIQVGSPKGVARFLQRAGRSGHQPGEVSRIYFLPTHSLELVEGAALKAAKDQQLIESRNPMLFCYDVLIQYLCSLAVGDGFYPEIIYKEVGATYCFDGITQDEFQEMLYFITAGGDALQQYDEYKKVEILEDGKYKINSRRIAMRHRLHIGTIVSDPMLKVKFLSGGYIGIIEEWFISRLIPGDVFTLSGRNLEYVMIKDMTVIVRKSSSKKSIVPSWQGGRMPLSANLGRMLRKKFNEATESLERNGNYDPEIIALKPLFQLQQELSHIPNENELLIEQIETKDGFHLFIYPFEGRLVHEALGAILAYRISKITPIT
ncbi:MAG: DEAD/DEAH box helicase, partial [Flavitalea sp.]